MEQVFGIVISIMFGAIFGSYATLFAYRLPLGESCFGRYFGPKSRCPKCDRIIKTRELIPLINWLITLGKCRGCGAKIPKTHLFVEVATTTLFVICYLKFSFSEDFIIFSLLSVACVILITTDYTHKIFPNSLLNFILLLSVASRILVDQNIIDVVYAALIGIIAAVCFYQIFYKYCEDFLEQSQVFGYTKFIIISSIYFQLQEFLTYFSAVLIFMSFCLLINSNKKNNYGYILILPFLYLLFS